MALSDLFARLRKDDDVTAAGATSELIKPTKALTGFLAGLETRQQPVLLDLGPVVGSNVTFFGGEVGCKVLIEDLSKDIERHVTQSKLAELPDFFEQLFPQDSETISGILCWDTFDYLERAAADRLARQLTRVLQPGGVLLAFFSTADPRSTIHPTYTRHVVIDRSHLEHRTYKAARAKQRPLLNRDIQRLFDPLRVTESFLLKTHQREVLFRKSVQAARAPFESALAVR
jgi:SAM-dependent methyltransferase